ncbi:MAG: hypothetical protein U0165_07945 [Polyangiaceae bacterium]
MRALQAERCRSIDPGGTAPYSSDHDIAARAGLSITVDAREVLADPTPPDGSAVLRGALGLVLK